MIFGGSKKYGSMEDPTFSLVLTRRQWTETPTVSNEEKRRPVIHWTFPRQGLEMAHGSFCKWNRIFLSNPQDMSKTKEGTQQNSLFRYQTWKHQKWPLHHLPQLINFIGVPMMTAGSMVPASIWASAHPDLWNARVLRTPSSLGAGSSEAPSLGGEG